MDLELKSFVALLYFSIVDLDFQVLVLFREHEQIAKGGFGY